MNGGVLRRAKPLTDRYGRVVKKFRISVTSVCNLKCPYCHMEGMDIGAVPSYLTLDQIAIIADLAVKYGVNTVKITGGEPLLHPKIKEIIKILKERGSFDYISITTNGAGLDKLAVSLKKAGVNGINIGCDTLDNPLFKNLVSAEKGIMAAVKAGFETVKVNMVVMKGINEKEVPYFIEYCKNNGIILQLIELIDSDHAFYSRYHIDLGGIERNLGKMAAKIINVDYNGRKRYCLENGGVVEVVRPMYNPDFCVKCITLRITADFKFKPCLRRNDNLVPIGNNPETAFIEAVMGRCPFYEERKFKRDT